MYARPYKIEDELGAAGWQWYPALDKTLGQNMDDAAAAVYKALSTTTAHFSPFGEPVPTLIIGLNNGDTLENTQWQHFNLVEMFKVATKEALENPMTTTDEELARIEIALTACLETVTKAKGNEAMTETNNFPKLGIKTEELRDCCEALIAKAQKEEDTSKWCVNWADIGVRSIEYRKEMLNATEEPYCVVTLDESDPSSQLARYVYSGIKHIFPKTYVECEW